MAGNMVDHMPQMPEPPVEVSEDEESNMECPSLSSLEESSEPEMGTSQWEWAFVKDARVEITRPPNSNCFSLVQPGHWKAASKGKDIRLNAAGKKSSSALYHRVTPVRDLGGGAQAAVWEQSAKNPKCRYRPVILRSIPGVMVVTWQWWWDEEKTKSCLPLLLCEFGQFIQSHHLQRPRAHHCAPSIESLAHAACEGEQNQHLSEDQEWLRPCPPPPHGVVRA